MPRITAASIRPLDLVLTLAVVVLGTLLMIGNVYDPEPGMGSVSFVAIPAFLVVTLPMLWRSTSPLLALTAVVVGLAAHTAVFGELIRCGAAFLTLALLTYAAGARLDGRDALAALGLGAGGALLVGAGDFLGFGVIVVGLPLVTLAWGGGRLMRARGRRAAGVATRGVAPVAPVAGRS